MPLRFRGSRVVPGLLFAHRPVSARHLERGSTWPDSLSGAGGAVLAVLVSESVLGTAPAAISARVASVLSATPRLEAYLGFLMAAAFAIGGAVGGALLLVLCERAGRRRLAPVSIALMVAAAGAWRAPWLVWAAPLAVVAIAPLLAASSPRPLDSPIAGPGAAMVCLASEAACLALGFWLPCAASFPRLLVPAMVGAGAIAAGLAAMRLRGTARWRVAFAGMPLLGLPLAGLARNPTILCPMAATLATLGACCALWRWPAAAARATRWARRNATVVAIPALVLVFVLPWHFRDLDTADNAGHEGQHLGWINSILFGKLMMADAGFTYGPGREYALAALSWALGGPTLEHVRLAHVVANVVGLGCLFAAMVRVAANRVHLLLIGILLLLTHSALVSWVLYTATYSFGWADASRAGLATLAVVMALGRDRANPGRRRGRLLGGVLAGSALLYSHDFGLPAVIATLVGFAFEILIPSSAKSLRDRVRAKAHDAAIYGAGLAIVVAPFLGFYAARGRLMALFAGYAWTAAVSGGALGGSAWPLKPTTLQSYRALTFPFASDIMGTTVLDYLIAPALAIVGLGHAALALVRRRIMQRTAVVAALAVLAALTLHHAFLRPDPWHLANSCTPGLVLLLAMAAGSPALPLQVSRDHWLSPGAAIASVIPLVWLAHGADVPLRSRIERINAGHERPSVGPPFRYDDIPRAGDVRVGDEHLGPVRYVRSHSLPGDPVFCTTWELGGGTEAFLSERRNPTSFDKPDEIALPTLRTRAFAELKRDPPLLIVGHYFDKLRDDARSFIDEGWHKTYDGGPEVRSRNR